MKAHKEMIGHKGTHLSFLGFILVIFGEHVREEVSTTTCYMN